MDGRTKTRRSYPESCTSSSSSRYSVVKLRNNSTNDSSSMISEASLEPPRKKRIRARLDHLTANEKLQRRKMKNRIAAQTARDRKRAKIEYLEEENRQLREENTRLRSQMESASQAIIHQQNNASRPPVIVVDKVSIDDSGVSDLDSQPGMSASSMGDHPEMDMSTPRAASDCVAKSCETATSSQSFTQPQAGGLLTVYHNPDQSLSPAPSDYLDSIIGEIDESAMMDDILQLQQSIFDDTENDKSIGSAELINAPQQQVQEMSFQSQLVENSAGWTSIQLMLLLMISRVHRLYSSKTNCCAPSLNLECDEAGVRANENLYDYLLETKCSSFRRAIDLITCNKRDVRRQKLVALEFVSVYLYRCGKIPRTGQGRKKEPM